MEKITQTKLTAMLLLLMLFCCRQGAFAQDPTVYTDETEFLAAVNSAYYTDDFSDAGTGSAPKTLTRSSGDFSYILSPGDGKKLYVFSNSVQTYNSVNMLVTNNGSEINAFGGYFYIADYNGNYKSGPITVTANEYSYTVTPTSAEFFIGFVYNSLITSDIIIANDNKSNYVTVADFTIGNTEGITYLIDDFDPISITPEAQTTTTEIITASSSSINWITSSSDSTWLTCSPSSGTCSATDTAILSISATVNNTIADRTDTIFVTDTANNITGNIIVSQEGTSVSTSGYSIESTETDSVITITAGGYWETTASDSWLTTDSATGTGSGTFTITASTNEGIAARTGTITVSDTITSATLTITIEQAAGVSVSTTAYSISNAETDSVITITANGYWETTASGSWLTTDRSTGTGSGTFTINATANTGLTTRTGTITISDTLTASTLTITVTQASSAYLTLSTDTITVPQTAGTTTLSVSSNLEWLISSGDTSLVSLDADTVSGSKDVTLTYTDNASIKQKISITIQILSDSTGLDFTSKTIVFFREGEEPYLTTERDTIYMDNMRGYVYDTTMVYSNATWEKSGYTACTKGDDYITTYTSAANRSGLTDILKGTITLTTTNTIDTTITKKIPVYLPGVRVASLFADSSGSSLDFTATDAWTIESSESWLTISPESGTGSGTLSYSATANTDSLLRTAYVTVKDSATDSVLYTLTVLQVSETPIELNNANISAFYKNFSLESTEYPNKANYILTEDITTPCTFPLGSQRIVIWGLAGSFDGDGHSIIYNCEPSVLENMSYYLDSFNALFRLVESTGSVRRLRIDGVVNEAATTWNYYQALLAGENKGTIEQVVVDGYVAGGQWVGSVAGNRSNGGTIKDCYMTGTASVTWGGNNSGGITPTADTLMNCMVFGTIEDIGSNRNKTYTVGYGGSKTSGLFYNIDSADVALLSNDYATGLTTGELTDSLETFEAAGWDIDSIGDATWYMMNGEGDHPRLRWEMAGPVNLTSTEGGETTIEPYRKNLYLKGTNITVTASVTGLNYKFSHFAVNDSIVTDETIVFDITEEMNIHAVYEFVPYLATSKLELSVADTAGSTGIFTISSDIPWSIESSDSWFSLNATEGSGDTTITVTAEANPYVTERTATLTISSDSLSTVKTITITQEAGKADFSVDVDNISVDSAATTASVTVTANTDWTASTSDTWFSISTESGTGDAEISVTIEENLDTVARSGIIVRAISFKSIAIFPCSKEPIPPLIWFPKY